MSPHATLPPLLSLILLAAALSGPAPAARAQDVGSSIVTAAFGVPAEGPGSPAAVYLTWWPTGNAAWSPASYAVYAKDGLPGDPGSFSLAGFVQPQTDILAVGFSLNRAQRVGEDLDALARNIDGLYDKVVPVASMNLTEKLAAIIAVSEFDPESAETLALLTRRHPAAALAAGVAFVDTLPTGATRTYEIRSCPLGSNDPAACTAVSGRVVVTGGEVKYLPSPGQPVHVPFVDPEGQEDPRANLNVPLRWATPDPLRERSFFQFGYDVYRVDPALANNKNWDTTEPNRTEFLAFLGDGTGRVERVNDLPVLTEELFSAANVADLAADPQTYFVIDDNGRYEENGQPFQDGDTFFYFVAGRDLLGRAGQISVGTPVTVCFRLPPPSPRGLNVTNHYTWDAATDTQTQVFAVSWEAALPREHGPAIAGYWIYRWESIEQLQQNQGLPFTSLPAASLTGGRIATVSANTTEYVDNLGPHPFITYTRGGDLEAAPVVDDGEANKTYWYTVRAIDASACSANISGNSAPAYGVLRGRVGPDAPGGSIVGQCLEPITTFQRASLTAGDEPFDPRLTYLRLEVERFSDEIAWVEFFMDPLTDERAFLGRFSYDQHTGPVVAHSVQVRTARLTQNDQRKYRVLARAGTVGGEVSELAEATFVPGLRPDEKTPGSFVQRLEFAAMVNREKQCDTHDPTPVGGGDGLVNPLQITLQLTPKTEEWKLYRRVDEGEISLLRQGIGSYNDTPVLTVSDSDLPLNGGRLCYFLQVFDQHGNPSVLQRIGCTVLKPRTSLPAPMLSAVQPIGNDPQSAGARISWFSPPAGVERFELWIRAQDGVVDEDISPDLRLNLPPEWDPFFSLRFTFADSVLVHRAFLTGRVGANLVAGPSFEIDWTDHLESGLEYFIQVRAIGAGGAEGPWSHVESFTWSAEIDFSLPFDPGDCVVPWPVRGTPPVNPNFPVPDPVEFIEVGLKAEINPTNPDGSPVYSGGAVRVGLVRTEKLDVNFPKNWDRLPGKTDQGIFQLPAPDRDGTLKDVFYQQQNGTPLLNFMLFRYQVPNALWPMVSGDVYQVSPLIEGLAHTEIVFQNQPAVAIYDPYFFVVEAPETGQGSRAFHLYLKDTQPVIVNASYRYLVVRFDDSGEIAQVIPLPTVTAN